MEQRKAVIIAIALVFLIQFARAEIVEKCKKIGPQCSADGKEILMCYQLEKPPKVIKNCGQQVCTDSGGQVVCKDEEIDSGNDVKFTCSGPGEFPDPFDCTVTYKCSGSKDFPAERCRCTGDGFVYPDAVAEFPCLATNDCPREEIRCKEGDYGEYTVNDQLTGICYFCTGNDAVTSYYCDQKSILLGKKRQETVKKCLKLTEPSSTPKPPTTTSKPSRPPECEPPKCSNSRCQTSTYPAECDCFYYVCDRYYSPVKRRCPIGTHYVHRVQRCVLGSCNRNCPDCN